MASPDLQRQLRRRVALSGAAFAVLWLTCQPAGPSATQADGLSPPGTTTQNEASEGTAGGDEPNASANEGTFDPGIASVDPESALGRARALAMDGDHAAARATALAALATASPDDLPVLRWIAARAAERTGNPAAAIAELAEIPAGHPLSQWARLERGRMLVEVDAARARAVLAPLGSETFPGANEARALEALAHAGTTDQEAETRLRAVIASTSGSRRAELERALAELLAVREEIEARVEALDLLRWIDARGPNTSAGRAAAERARAVLASLPEARRRTLAVPTIDQARARAEALAAALDHRDAEEAYRALSSRLRRDDEARCAARVAEGRAMYQRRARAESAALLSQIATECRAFPEHRAVALWYLAKSYSGRDLLPEAIAQYDVLAEELPEHRLADDALINASRLARERGDVPGAEERLQRIVDTMPAADMRNEALFLLAFGARNDGRLEVALAHLDVAVRDGGENAEDLRGRAMYWRARVLEQSGDRDHAIEQYAALAAAFPLSYYAQQAYSRLRGLDPDRARASLPARRENAPALRLAVAGAPGTSAGMSRAIALLRAGELGLAEREMDDLGLLARDAAPEWLWIAAALFERAGGHSKSCEIVRRRLRDRLMSSPPVGHAFLLWRLGYPLAYSPLIDTTASTENVPASFVRAIAREESSFRADAVSIARAYGLLQIIRPTAQRIARPLGLASDPDALRTPEVNVRIGVRYIAWLRSRFEANHALVPAAYNAGEGAVDRWLRERGDRSLDEFIEEIPYDETRRYTRRVLQTWGIYAFLEDGSLPEWPSTLPAAR